MAIECDSTRMTEGKADDSVPAAHGSLSSQANQNFRNLQFSGNSRTQIGNIYQNNIYNNLDQQDDSKIKAEILMAALEFNGMKDRLFTVSPAYANTCSWFLQSEEHMRWLEPAKRASHNGVLWIKGKAGTGKSTVMRYIHDYAQKKSAGCITLAFFFHGRSQESLLKSTQGMYRSILYQLYHAIPRLKTLAAERLISKTQHTWSLEMLEDLFREAVLGLEMDEHVRCYIDALDECADERVRAAVKCFENLSQSATRENKSFLICFASRYYPHITMQAYVESRLDAKYEHLQDIRQYLRECLNMPSSIKSELQAQILERCSGIFLWVVLVVEMLKEGFDEGADRSQLLLILESLPRELHALFARISQSANARFAVAMRWVLFAKRPLKPEELYFAIRSASGDLASAYWDKEETSLDTIKKFILHASRGLIECTEDPIRSPFPERCIQTQFVHESVRQYLISGNLEESTSESEQDLVAISHTKIAHDCQQYLELCVHGDRNVTNIKHKARCESIDKHYPLSLYAINNVFQHLEDVYLYNSQDINLIGFPIGHYTVIRGYTSFASSSDPLVYVGRHTANFLNVLIESEFDELAEHYLQSVPWSDVDALGYIKRCTSCAAAPAPSDIDLSTCCGGAYGGPLHAAVAKKNFRLVRLLLAKGANADPSRKKLPKASLRNYRNPLILALQHESKKMMQLLIDHGASVNRVDPQNGLRPLHTLFNRPPSGGRFVPILKKVKLLLSLGANVNLLTDIQARGPSMKSYAWSTALHIAVGEHDGHDVDALHELLRAGAIVNATNFHDETPLIIAALQDKPKALKLLLDHGANAEYRSRWRGTAIATAEKFILRSLLLDIRLRALAGKDGFLPLAARPADLPLQRHPSQIPAPTRTHSQRTEQRLQYRHPPRTHQLYYTSTSRYDTGFWRKGVQADPTLLELHSILPSLTVRKASMSHLVWPPQPDASNSSGLPT